MSFWNVSHFSPGSTSKKIRPKPSWQVGNRRKEIAVFVCVGESNVE